MTVEDEWTRERILATFADNRPVVDISGLQSPIPRAVWDDIGEAEEPEPVVLDLLPDGWVALV